MNPIELARAFDARGVQYCVVGGVAATMHGVVRDTFDLDVLLVPSAANLQAAALALRDVRLRPHVPIELTDLSSADVRRQLREERNLIAVGFIDASDPFRRVDILLDGPFEVADVVARAVDRAGVKVISAPDLIVMKRAAGRPKDLDDAEWLVRLEQES